MRRNRGGGRERRDGAGEVERCEKGWKKRTREEKEEKEGIKEHRRGRRTIQRKSEWD